MAEINLNKIKTYSLKKRKSKINLKEFAGVCSKGVSFKGFYKSLPHILAAENLRAIADAIILSCKNKKQVIFMLGAHVIKCGLSPLIIELINKGVIKCICLNGAGVIHDFEIAYAGFTSEDVLSGLENGNFGMAKETAEFINSAIVDGQKKGFGLGRSVGQAIKEGNLAHKNLSILHHAVKKAIPVCVSVAIGTDIIHQHPSFDGAATGWASQKDFKTFVEMVSLLEGGVIVNFGSAVILPEVFLKALNLARNLGFKIKNFTTANFDMIYHYRPAQNLVSRPTKGCGKGFYIIGHHEIMLPLLTQAIIEQVK
ncbi:MAG: hypothetical protein Q8O13_04130 [Candidatus Omnitrophota bacterium]|nr:hypothetical protein [Candidatus Omnitrophota bacterium]